MKSLFPRHPACSPAVAALACVALRVAAVSLLVTGVADAAPAMPQSTAQTGLSGLVPLTLSVVLGLGILLGIVGARAITWLRQRAGTKSAGAAADATGAQAVSTQSMAVLSEIDRSILSGARFERVIAVLLRAAPKIFDDGLIGVTALGRDGQRAVRTYFAQAGGAGPNMVERVEINPRLLQQLAQSPKGCVIEKPGEHAFLAPLFARGALQALLLPVFLDARLAAVLIVGACKPSAIAGATRQFASDAADRLSVALTAATRDQQLHFQSNYDEITTLPNRHYLQDRLAQEIGRALREARGFALLFVNLDQFKNVNDTQGHAAGDAALEQAGRRIRHCVRNEDVVARFGGDEFVVLLPAIGSPNDAARVAEKLLEALVDPFMIHAQAHQLGATVGISMFPDDGRTADRLMRSADFAMSRAKAAGRGQYMFYDQTMHIEVQRRVEIEADLRAALARGDLQLHYQPQIDLSSGKISGVEGLLRWTHAEFGAVSPMEFIAIAEQSSLIEEIGVYVRAAACRQYCAWQAQGLAPPRISVNVSAREVRRSGFAGRIRAELEQFGMRGRCLELELTESLLAENSPQVKETLAELRAMGLLLAIDDFGTGYSSMSYLREYPFTCLKIDRAFVSGINAAAGADAIVRAILGLARGLDLEVVAEGVENAAQQAFLAAEGCQLGQGYLWSKALPADEFARLMRQWVARPGALASAGARLVAV